MIGSDASPVGGKHQALEEVLGSETFLRSDQLRRFLRYICEMEISGKGPDISEYSIAAEALGRGAGFVPSQDTIVRNRAHVLRQRLKEFYAKENPQSSIRIELPKGSYVPRFVSIPYKEPETRPDRKHITGMLIGFLTAAVLFGAVFLGVWAIRKPSGVDPVVREAWGPLAMPHSDPVLVLGIATHLIVRGFPKGARPDSSAIDLPAPPNVAAFHDRRSPRTGEEDLHMLQSESLRFGEAMAAVVAARSLESMGVGYQVLPDIAIRLATLRSRNAILVGDPTLIPIISQDLQRAALTVKYDASVRDFVVKERAESAGQPLTVTPDAPVPGRVREIPGLLTVLPSDDTPGGNKRTVILSCSMSVGCQAAAEFFSSPNALRDLRDRFRKERINGFPRAYQVVVKARSDGVLLLSFRYEAHRVLDRSLP
jgi:hypothetical protein